MHKLKLRTKIEILVAITFLILLVVSSVISISRTISDTHDDIYTFIWNSNGNYWPATGANIQAAIDDIGIVAPSYNGYGGTHGTVWLPGNTTLTVSSTVQIKDHVTLNMGGCEVKPNGNFNLFMLHTGAQLRNGCVNVSSVANFDSAAVTINCYDMIDQGDHIPIIENMQLVSTASQGKGIYINTSGTVDQWAVTRFNNIQIESFEYAIFINHTATGPAYLNANVFTNIEINNTKYCITVYEEIAEASGNYFENIRCYCTSITEYVIWNNGHGNLYDNIQAFNWDNNSGTRTAYNFTEGFSGDWSGAAHCCYLCFRGGGNDISFPAWHQWQNAYTILNLENSELIIGNVVEENP